MARQDDPIVIALDVGTTYCKAAAYDARGSLLGAAQHGYATRSPEAGHYEQRPEEWIGAARRSLKRVADMLGDAAERVGGVGLTAWGPSLVFVDADGKPTTDAAPTWQDSRSAAQGERLIREVGTEWIGGGMPTTGFPAKLAWAIDHDPALAEEAAFAVGVKEVVLAWLTGTIATDPSSGPFGPAWNEDVFSAIGWPLDRLPEVRQGTDVGGRLRPTLARVLHLPADVPVFVGVNDGASATVGAGAVAPGNAVISLGTNGVLRVVVERPPDSGVCLNSGLFRYPLLAGTWVTGGFALAGGGALEWLAQIFAPGARGRGPQRLVNEVSGAVLQSTSPFFLPYLVGRGSPGPDPEARAVFARLSLEHGRPEMIVAVLEGVAMALREIRDALAARGYEIGRIVATGGGARSDAWLRLLASVLGAPIGRATGSSPLGIAAVAATGLGIYPDVASAVRVMVPSIESFEPDAALAALAEDRYQTYMRLGSALT